MIPVSVQHAAQVLGVAPVGDGDAGVPITSLVADSRAVTRVALRGPARGACRRPRLRRAARADGAAAALVSRPVDGGLCLVVADPLIASGPPRPRPGGCRARTRSPRSGDHRLPRQDLDQGPTRAASRADRPHRGGAGQSEQRARCSADRRTNRADDPVPDRRDGRPRHRTHCVPLRHRTPRVGLVLNVGHAHVGRIRRIARPSPRPRASWSRPCPPTGWRCSTPTIRWSGPCALDERHGARSRRAEQPEWDSRGLGIGPGQRCPRLLLLPLARAPAGPT